MLAVSWTLAKFEPSSVSRHEGVLDEHRCPAPPGHLYEHVLDFIMYLKTYLYHELDCRDC